MKQPLQALLIAPDETMRSEIISGNKQISIREGSWDYKSGPVMLCCHIEPWCVMADIVSVIHSKLGKVNQEDLIDDGFFSHEEALNSLKKFYKDITLDSNITIIRWENVRGKLVSS